MRSTRYSLRDFLLFRVPDLEKIGATAEDRFLITGHSRHMNKLWIESVGMWGRSDTSDFVGPDSRLRIEKPDSYAQYKHKHGLLSAYQLRSVRDGLKPWYLASKAGLAVAELQGRLNGACPMGYAGYLVTKIDPSFGLLPVEVVLWNTVFQEFLNTAGLLLQDWESYDADEKTELWDARNEDTGSSWHDVAFHEAFNAKLY